MSNNNLRKSKRKTSASTHADVFHWFHCSCKHTQLQHADLNHYLPRCTLRFTKVLFGPNIQTYQRSVLHSYDKWNLLLQFVLWGLVSDPFFSLSYIVFEENFWNSTQTYSRRYKSSKELQVFWVNFTNKANFSIFQIWIQLKNNF